MNLSDLDQRITGCRACPRLVAWREEVARTKRAAFADWTYWGRPVPGFGPADAPLLIIGLAPAAHGANRTGRMFTGDRSGDVLYEALYDVGLASQPTAVSADDGLELYGVRITSPVRCAPARQQAHPGGARHLSFLARRGTHPAAADVEGRDRARRLRLAGRAARVHGGGLASPAPTARVRARRPGLLGGIDLFGCFHVSQRNTFTGKLTPAMLRDVLRTAAGAAGLATTP